MVHLVKICTKNPRQNFRHIGMTESRVIGSIWAIIHRIIIIH